MAPSRADVAGTGAIDSDEIWGDFNAPADAATGTATRSACSGPLGENAPLPADLFSVATAPNAVITSHPLPEVHSDGHPQTNGSVATDVLVAHICLLETATADAPEALPAEQANDATEPDAFAKDAWGQFLQPSLLDTEDAIHIVEASAATAVASPSPAEVQPPLSAPLDAAGPSPAFTEWSTSDSAWGEFATPSAAQAIAASPQHAQVTLSSLAQRPLPADLFTERVQVAAPGPDFTHGPAQPSEAQPTDSTFAVYTGKQAPVQAVQGPLPCSSRTLIEAVMQLNPADSTNPAAKCIEAHDWPDGLELQQGRVARNVSSNSAALLCMAIGGKVDLSEDTVEDWEDFTDAAEVDQNTGACISTAAPGISVPEVLHCEGEFQNITQQCQQVSCESSEPCTQGPLPEDLFCSSIKALVAAVDKDARPAAEEHSIGMLKHAPATGILGVEGVASTVSVAAPAVDATDSAAAGSCKTDHPEGWYITGLTSSGLAADNDTWEEFTSAPSVLHHDSSVRAAGSVKDMVHGAGNVAAQSEATGVMNAGPASSPDIEDQAEDVWGDFANPVAPTSETAERSGGVEDWGDFLGGHAGEGEVRPVSASVQGSCGNPAVRLAPSANMFVAPTEEQKPGAKAVDLTDNSTAVSGVPPGRVQAALDVDAVSSVGNSQMLQAVAHSREHAADAPLSDSRQFPQMQDKAVHMNHVEAAPGMGPSAASGMDGPDYHLQGITALRTSSTGEPNEQASSVRPNSISIAAASACQHDNAMSVGTICTPFLQGTVKTHVQGCSGHTPDGGRSPKPASPHTDAHLIGAIAGDWIKRDDQSLPSSMLAVPRPGLQLDAPQLKLPDNGDTHHMWLSRVAQLSVGSGGAEVQKQRTLGMSDDDRVHLAGVGAPADQVLLSAHTTNEARSHSFSPPPVVGQWSDFSVADDESAVPQVPWGSASEVSDQLGSSSEAATPMHGSRGLPAPSTDWGHGPSSLYSPASNAVSLLELRPPSDDEGLPVQTAVRTASGAAAAVLAASPGTVSVDQVQGGAGHGGQRDADAPRMFARLLTLSMRRLPSVSGTEAVLGEAATRCVQQASVRQHLAERCISLLGVANGAARAGLAEDLTPQLVTEQTPGSFWSSIIVIRRLANHLLKHCTAHDASSRVQRTHAAMDDWGRVRGVEGQHLVQGWTRNGLPEGVVLYMSSILTKRRAASEARRLRQILEAFKVPFEEVDLAAEPHRRSRMLRTAGDMRDLPQLHCCGRFIGTASACFELHDFAELMPMLQSMLAPTSGDGHDAREVRESPRGLFPLPVDVVEQLQDAADGEQLSLCLEHVTVDEEDGPLREDGCSSVAKCALTGLPCAGWRTDMLALSWRADGADGLAEVMIDEDGPEARSRLPVIVAAANLWLSVVDEKLPSCR